MMQNKNGVLGHSSRFPTAVAFSAIFDLLPKHSSLSAAITRYLDNERVNQLPTL